MAEQGNDGRDPAPPVQGLERRSTELALERLSQRTRQETKFSRWYQPAQDYYFYSAAETALRATEARLKKLSLTPEERRTLTSSNDLEALTKKAKEINALHDVKKGDPSPIMKWLSKFTNNFCDFAIRISDIVELLIPQSPEYTVTYGLLMVMFNAVVDKKEKEDDLQDSLTSITDALPIMSFYEDFYPTNEMKMTIAAIFVEIIIFLEQATRYYCLGRGRKFVDAIFKSPKYNFDTYLSNIEIQKKKMIELKDAALVAQANDMKNAVDDTGLVVARLFKNFDTKTTALGNSVALLSQRLDTLQKNQSYITTFHANLFVQMLREDVYCHVQDADTIFEGLTHRYFRLSEKDHWDNNGVLASFSAWANGGRKTILWIGGDSGNRDNWVTEISVNLIRALEFQEQAVLYMFCGATEEPVTPHDIAAQLVVQMLQKFPMLAFQTPNRFNSRRLKKYTSFAQLWSLWESLLSEETSEIFVVVDRIDLCESDGDSSIEEDILPGLLNTTRQHSHVSIVVTSGTEPPPDFSGDSSELQSTCIDTAITAHRRYDKRYG